MKLIDEFMDAQQAAEQLGLTRDEVYRLVRLKRLRCHKFGANGGLYRFHMSDLKAYIQSCASETRDAVEPIYHDDVLPPHIANSKLGKAAKAIGTKLKHLKG